jgi:hypothetical protein
MPNDVRELYEAGREQELTAAADFATLARELRSDESERGTLQAVCELAREPLKADHAAFTALKRGRFHTVASTGELPPGRGRDPVRPGHPPLSRGSSRRRRRRSPA